MADINAEVVVIGAGIVGMSTARYLAGQGHKVIVLEKSRPGSEASGRNGGGLRQQSRHPAERPLALKAAGIWAGLEDEWGCDLEYHAGGNIRLLTSAEELAQAKERVADENAEGLEVHLLDPGQTRERLAILNPELEIWGSTFCPSDATANPLLVMRHLRRVLAEMGVEVRGHEPVLRLEAKAGRLVRAITAKASYGADTFLVAAGAWTPDLVRPLGLEVPILARKSKLILTEPVSPILESFVIFDGGYLRQAADGNFHLGVPSNPAGSENLRIGPQDLAKAAELFLDKFPLLRKLSIIRGFAGTTAWPPDAFPILDAAPGLSGLYLAAGFSGHGFFIGPAAGEFMGRWLESGQRPAELSPFGLARLKEIGEVSTNAW